MRKEGNCRNCCPGDRFSPKISEMLLGMDRHLTKTFKYTNPSIIYAK